MRPLHLTIEGLRSFRAPVSIDFDGRDHVAIVGDTGAGKSSILEAITYALYGQTTFTAQANQELMNDTSLHLRVVLRFRVSGETWEVARTLRRDGQGRVGSPGAQLRRLGADGEAIEQVEQVKPVNDGVKALLGLDSDAFLRTVVLPQGRFARLLVEDKPADRGRILRQVWRTDELEAAGDLAGTARQEAEKLRERLAQAASTHPDDPAAHLAALQTAQEAASRDAAVASEDERAASDAHETVLAARQARQAAAAVAERLRTLDVKRAAGVLAPIASAERDIVAEETSHEERQARLEKALERVPADDGPTREEVTAALTTLGGLGDLAKAAEAAAADQRATADDAARKRTEARRLAEHAKTARTRAAEHAEKRSPLDEAAEAARRQRDAVDEKHARCAERAAERDTARGRLETLRAEEAACAKDLESAQDAAHRATREAAAAEEHLAAARRSESAAAAARDLHAGAACPICRRDLPGDWKAPDAEGLADAEAVARAAAEAARHAGADLIRLRTRGEALSSRAADARAGLADLDAALATARQELAREAGAAPPAAPTAAQPSLLDAEAPLAALLDAEAPLPGRDTLLVPLETASAEAAALLAEHDRLAEELRADAAARETAAGVAREAAAGAGAHADRSSQSAARAVERLETTIGTVPEPFRPRLVLPADAAGLREVDLGPVTGQRESAEARARVLEARDDERKRLRGEIEDTRRARAALAGRRREEIDAPLEALVRDLHGSRDALVESVGRLTLDVDVPAAVSTREVRALESHVAALRTTAAELSKAAGEHARAADERADAARARLEAIGRRLDAAIDPGNLDAVVAGVRAKAEDARFEARRAVEAADGFGAIVDDVRDLRAHLQEVEGRALALADLEDALKPGAFLKWLTLRRSRRLLVHASRMLDEMSGGRYAFVDPGEAEEQWRVLDHDSGQARSPASLSGGEQFIASLSLALGMVEMVARTGGRLESLFLDEGFGSLDRHNLDAAVQALGAVAAGGRMVGVISHVRAVAEQIDHVLAVTRGATGSRAEWLTSGQRRQLSESDTGLEAASALAGLLE